MNLNNLLVTGAGGMLGRHLLQEMVNDSKFDEYNILTPTRLELDLTDDQKVLQYIEKFTPKIVIHLAAKVRGLQGNLNHPVDSLLENERIANNLLNACLRRPPKVLFFAGTAASYGWPYQKFPLEEKHFLIGDVHKSEFGYAWAKRSAYSRMSILNNDVGTSAIYGILTNLFGPHDRFSGVETHVIPALIAKAVDAQVYGGKRFEVWGVPETTRDFLYAKDAARAIIHLIGRNSEVPPLVNICSGSEVSIGEVAELIRSTCALEGVDFVRNKPIGIPRRVLSNQLLVESGFRYQTSLKEGIAETVTWYLMQNRIQL